MKLTNASQTSIFPGPAGLGSPAKKGLNYLKEHSIKRAELPFTYRVFLTPEKAEQLKMDAIASNVDLSVHAPYYVNLATDDEEKLLQCKQRIMESCRIAHILDAKQVVFHPGYYQDKSQKTASNIIQNQILLLMEQIEKENLNIILCPETTGRKSEFGHIEELLKIQDQTGCGICIDFSHILARSGGSIRFKEMVEMIPKREHLHCHYSGIRWTDKGEAGHEPMEKEQFQELASAIISSKKFKTVTIICEAPPDTKTGSVLMQKWLKEI